MLATIFVLAVAVILSMMTGFLVVADIAGDHSAARRFRHARMLTYEQYIINCTARGVEPKQWHEFWGRR